MFVTFSRPRSLIVLENTIVSIHVNKNNYLCQRLFHTVLSCFVPSADRTYSLGAIENGLPLSIQNPDVSPEVC